MKYSFPILVIAAVLFTACGNNKTTDETNTQDSTATDSTNTVDSLLNDNTSSITSPHPVSDWARRNPMHPFFNSNKVDELVNGKAVYTPNDEEMMDYTHDHLNKTEMAKLTVVELMYYCFKYPCSFSQICAADEWQDSTNTPKIPGYLPSSYSGDLRSEWQMEALQKRRDSVLIVMNDYLSKNPDDLDPEFLGLLLEMKAVESIPTMKKNATVENNGYSFLLALMMEKKYAPFMKTGMYQRLYGDEGWRYGNRLEANKTNIDSIKVLATQMYNEHKK